MKKSRIKIFAAAIILVLIVCFCFLPIKTDIGIDISHHNRLTDQDWKELAAREVHFVYIKASEGATYKDPKRLENTKAATKIDIYIGYYHFFNDNCSAKRQFENYREATKEMHSSLIPVIDFENDGLHDGISSKKRFKILSELCALFEKQYGCFPIIYCNHNHYVPLKVKFPKAKFWIGCPSFNMETIAQYKETINGKEIDFNKADIESIIN